MFAANSTAQTLCSCVPLLLAAVHCCRVCAHELKVGGDNEVERNKWKITADDDDDDYDDDDYDFN